MKIDTVGVMAEATENLLSKVHQVQDDRRETVWGLMLERERDAELVLSIAPYTPRLIASAAFELHGVKPTDFGDHALDLIEVGVVPLGL